ncbi:MAG: ABC transporter permease [Eubacteriales bacterium]|nr:ABC transporter permease [Eubacteriales bacterium]
MNMLLTCVRMEWKKLRRSRLWLVMAAVPLLPAFMGTGNYLNNLGILKSEWYSLWTQLSLFYANFFYGPLIALYCSYIWRVEHLNHNWNSLMTMPVPVRNVFLGKLFPALVCTFLLQGWMGVLLIVCGKYAGLSGMPSAQILLWLLRGTAGGMVIASLQLLLSMVIRSFAAPIALALLGSVVGLFASNAGCGLLWPYSLMLEGMNANRSEDMVSSGADFAAGVLCFLLLFVTMGVLILKKRDVRTGG